MNNTEDKHDDIEVDELPDGRLYFNVLRDGIYRPLYTTREHAQRIYERLGKVLCSPNNMGKL